MYRQIYIYIYIYVYTHVGAVQFLDRALAEAGGMIQADLLDHNLSLSLSLSLALFLYVYIYIYVYCAIIKVV